CVQGTDYPLTF
nr:immunoglobulin light chain junction region [Macaca mulatta]MOV34101.1 immunoglobulin light chain junction region [Macaca mulatta]MOV34263.1 immunoglobulin light chain junction region [Macaca mulatta]MOV34490.1 immunoglobulin light chain junction region [Macaca mulatta]MOV34668.1 immunoglobulin light chain junction region [Macaca mulatta]